MVERVWTTCGFIRGWDEDESGRGMEPCSLFLGRPRIIIIIFIDAEDKKGLFPGANAK